MKTLALILFVLVSFCSYAQIGKKELKTDSGKVIIHYFQGGKTISTKEWTDAQNAWGTSWAYDKEGKIIYEGQTRNIGGHASVWFKYHSNGGIALAEYSSAPDGGIQWHKSKTSFDEYGTRLSHDEWGHDDDGIYPGPGVKITSPTKPYAPDVPLEEPVQKQEVVECQKLFANDFFVVNNTKHAMRAEIKPKHPSPGFKESTYTLAPGDTIKVGTYSMGEVFETPEKHASWILQRVTLKKKKKELRAQFVVNERILNPETKEYYLTIHNWKK